MSHAVDRRGSLREPLFRVATVLVVAGSMFALTGRASSAVGRLPADSAVTTTYLSDCAVCHGATGQGGPRGPTLVGVGAASADYELSTGRMPIDDPTDVPKRHAPKYSPALQRGLTDLVASFGSGPAIPTVSLAGAALGSGGEVFRLNCAACHQSVGRGGALADREAPALSRSTPVQVAEAVRIGPGQMPAFGAAAIDDQGLADLAAYVEYLHHPNDRGGLSIWHLGPVPEGAIAIGVGLVVLIALTVWIERLEKPKNPTNRPEP